MNWFDLTAGILLLVAAVKGYRKGLVIQLVGLATIILAAVFGGKAAAMIQPQIENIVNLTPEASKVLSFILAFAGIALILSLIGRLLQRFIDITFLGFFNRVAGAIIAAGTMMVFLSIILNLVLMLDHEGRIIHKNIKEESFFFERVEAVVPAVVPYLEPELWEDIVPEKFRDEIENKGEPIDSAYQQRYFKTDAEI